MNFTEGTTPSLICSWLKRGVVVPTCDCSLGVLGFAIVGDSKIGTCLVEAGALIRVDTSNPCFRGGWLRQLSSALALGHLLEVPASAPATSPAAATMVNEAPTPNETPIVPAAAHPREALAEVANMMRSAETVAPIRS